MNETVNDANVLNDFILVNFIHEIWILIKWMAYGCYFHFLATKLSQQPLILPSSPAVLMCQNLRSRVNIEMKVEILKDLTQELCKELSKVHLAIKFF